MSQARDIIKQWLWLRASIIALLVIGTYPIVGSATDLSGNVSGTLTFANSPYVVIGDITISPGETLTIEPGVAIKFNLGYSMFVRGVLMAQGSAQSPIYFTSIRDDGPFGDTNGDGSSTSPSPGDWGRIEFLESAGNSGVMANCVIRYGGNFLAMIRVFNASPTIRNSVIDSSRFVAGLSMESGGNPIVENNRFRGNVTAAIRIEPNVFPRFAGNTASGNGVNGIVFPGGTITRSGRWSAVDLPYVIAGDLSVGDTDANTPPISLTLRPGAVVKLNGTSFFVRDSLAAVGKPDSLIVFTSFPDDLYGGDTNNDGNATRPAPGQWGRIEFGESSGSSGLVAHCLLRYGGNFFAMVRVFNASPAIRNSVIDSSRFVAGLSLESGGNPIVENNRFRGNAIAAIRIEPNVFPRFAGNTAFGNGVNGIVFPGGTVTRSGRWSAVDLPYVIAGDLGIGDANTNTPPITLTLRPGAVVKSNGASIFVQDSLIAVGKPDSLIVFTSFSDDLYGGDANNDDNATQPAPGQWGRIEFAASSGNSSLMAHCLIRYGGNFLAMIRVFNASPTIRNSAIDSSRFVAGLSLENGGNPIIENNRFRGNITAAVRIEPNVFPRFAGNTAFGNGVNGIVVPGGTITRSGRWNAVDLPYVIAGDLGVGDTDANTPPINLTLRPGAVVKLNGTSMFVRDSLAAAGKSDSLIVFTSFADDLYGGDANNNGNTTRPAPGQWGRIEFAASSGNSSLMAHCLIRYGGNFLAMVRVFNASPTIRNSAIDSSRFVAGLSLESGGNPIIENNRFRGNVTAAIRIEPNVFPHFAGNTAFGNGVNGIVVPGGTITSSGRWSAVDLPYVIAGDLGVGDTNANTPPINLTLRPGAVVKLNGTSFFVRDSLTAAGKSDSLIVFTSFADDLYGGDTNNDGNATQPAPGQWGRIEFAASSGNSGAMAHGVFRYGGNFFAMIRVVGASPSFSHCKIEASRFVAGMTIENGSAATVLRNVIVNNGGDGIGVFASSPKVINNTIVNNGRDGISNASNSATSIKNNIIVNNSRYGIFCDAGSQAGAAISYNDVWNNAIANYQGCGPGVGDLSEDPLFIDAAGGVFRLLSRSPCVNAGDPNEFDPGTDSRVDMGAFPFSGIPGAPIRIVAVSGNGQNWYVENPLPNPLVVEVTDAFVNGVAGVKIDFAITAGSGLLDTETINTDNNGRAQTRWTLGEEVGTQRVEARAADFDGNLLAGVPLVFTAFADSLPPPPRVEFAAANTSGFTPLQVRFTSQTAGVFTELLWHFGDGDSSTAINPQHTYPDSGVYTVSLQAVGPGGEDRLVKENYITARLRIYGSIAGRVVDFDGREPVAGVQMRVTGATTKDTTTDGRGNYLLSLLRVGTDYMLAPARAGMFFQPPKIEFPVFNDDFTGRNFTASLYGDVSGNDRVQSFDASVLLRYLVGLLPLNDLPRDSIAADVSGNGDLNAFDASLILRFAAGLIDKFPVDTAGSAKAFAAVPSNPKSVARLEARKLQKDTRVTIPVFFESAEEIYSCDLSLTFDPEMLKLANVSAGEMFADFLTVHSQSENTIRIALAGAHAVSGNGVLLLLDWEVLAEAGNARAPLALTHVKFNESPAQIVNAPFENLPTVFHLWQNYPNPFNPQTRIAYDLPKSILVRLEIFNVLGQKVKTLVNEQKSAGSHTAVWDGRMDDGGLAASGIYICRLKTEAYVQNRTLLFLR